MKKFILSFFFIFSALSIQAIEDVDSIYNLEEITVTDVYKTNISNSNTLSKEEINKNNNGQEPSFILSKQPSIFAWSDTGNEYGYAYFKLRGMNQTRINMSLDGMPLNDGEDLGVYFSNIPELIGSTNSITIERGASITNNGICGYAGSLNFESVDLKQDRYTTFKGVGGSFNTFVTSFEHNSGYNENNIAYNIKVSNKQSDGYKDYAYNSSQSTFAKIGWKIDDYNVLEFLTFSGLSRNGQGWIGSSMEDLKENEQHNGCTAEENDRFFQTINKLQYTTYYDDFLIWTSSVYYNHLNGWYDFDVNNYMQKFVDITYRSDIHEIDRYNMKHHMIGGNSAVKLFVDNMSLTSGVNGSLYTREHVGTWNLDNSTLYENKGLKDEFSVFFKWEVNSKYVSAYINNQYRITSFDYKGDVSFDKINWRFFNISSGLSFHLSKHSSLYGTVTNAHKEPTRTDMFGGLDNFETLYTKQHESVRDFEIGFNHKTDKLYFNINYYHMDFDNELILNGEYGANGLAIRNNIAKSTRNGVECTLSYKPWDWLSIVNNSSWSSNTVKQDGYEYNHTLSPSWLINQSIEYVGKNLNIGLNCQYRDKMNVDLNETFILDESFKFNGYIHYKINKNLTCSFMMNNILNSTTYSNGMFGVNNTHLYFTDAPRNFNVGLKVNL